MPPKLCEIMETPLNSPVVYRAGLVEPSCVADWMRSTGTPEVVETELSIPASSHSAEETGWLSCCLCIFLLKSISVVSTEVFFLNSSYRKPPRHLPILSHSFGTWSQD